MTFLSPLKTLVKALAIIALFLGAQASYADEAVQVPAVIESVILTKQMLKVTHDPVPSWGWMKMKMKFAVAEGVDLKALQEGQKVMLTMIKGADGKATITAVE